MKRRTRRPCLQASAAFALLTIVGAARGERVHAAGASAQTAARAEASTSDRLARVQRALFSGGADIHAAIRELKAILAIDPGSRDAHALLGIAYRGLGTQEFIAEAVAEFRQALAIDPHDAPTRLYLAYAYRDLGRLERAREELQTALAQAPGNPQVLALLGDTERQLGNPGRAVELARQALAADPQFVQARYYLGLALIDVGRREDGIREIEQVVRSGMPVADAYLALGTAYLEGNRVRDAIDILSRGVAIDASRPDLRIRLARALRTSGELAQAETQLAQAAAGRTGSRLEQQQLESDLALEQGLLRLAEGKLATAAGALQRVLKMDPDHGPANRGLATIYLRQGAYARAAEHAARADRAGAPLGDAERELLRQKVGRIPEAM